MSAWHLTHGNRKCNGNTKKASVDSAQIKGKGKLHKSGGTLGPDGKVRFLTGQTRKKWHSRPKNQHMQRRENVNMYDEIWDR